MENDTITLVSTTDTAEDVQASLTGVAAPVADPAAEPAKTEEPVADPAKPEGETQAQKDERRASRRETRKATIQEEIDELTRQKHNTRRDVEAEQARLAELRGQLAEIGGRATPPARTQPAAEPQGVSRPKPALEAVDADGKRIYDTYEAWVDDTGAWHREQSLLETRRLLEEREHADRVRIEREKAFRVDSEYLATYENHLEAFRERTPTFDADLLAAKEDVVEVVQELGPNALNVIDRYTTVDAENGPALVHYLATNPDEMRRIAGLPVPLQLAALGKLDGKLDAASPSPNGPALRVPPQTKAPKPMTPLGSSPTASVTTDPEKETYQQWKERRNREEAAARR